MPIMIMGFAVRKHILATLHRQETRLGSFAAGFAGVLSGIVFIGQIVGKWQEGGWVVLISFSILVLVANAISDFSHRLPRTKTNPSHRARKSAGQGAMASIVEWQSLRMQEYRYSRIGMASPISLNYSAFAVQFDMKSLLLQAIMTTPCTWIIPKRLRCSNNISIIPLRKLAALRKKPSPAKKR